MKSNKAASSFEEFQVLWKSAAFEESMVRCTSHTSAGLWYFGNRDTKRLQYPYSEALESKIEPSLERRLESQADNVYRAEEYVERKGGRQSYDVLYSPRVLPGGTNPHSTMSAESNSMTHHILCSCWDTSLPRGFEKLFSLLREVDLRAELVERIEVQRVNGLR